MNILQYVHIPASIHQAEQSIPSTVTPQHFHGAYLNFSCY